LHLASYCQATSGGGGDAIAAGGSAAWRETTSVRSPDEPIELEGEMADADLDVASFMSAGSEVLRPDKAAAQPISAAGVVLSPSGVDPVPLLSDADIEMPLWESNFAKGVFESKKAVEADDLTMGAWMFDAERSGAAVPARMLEAEVLLQASEEASTSDTWKAKTSERALRLYYHAKWLAERNYARAAEYRYREAAQLAQQSRRSVLASHSLARLGYFLMHWGRIAEATEILQDSMKLNIKANPLAPYLHGVIDRKQSAGDIERLRVAEDHILKAGEQPSEELNLERAKLMEEIHFWRAAEASPHHCLGSADAAHVLICLCGHAASFLNSLFS